MAVRDLLCVFCCMDVSRAAGKITNLVLTLSLENVQDYLHMQAFSPLLKCLMSNTSV